VPASAVHNVTTEFKTVSILKTAGKTSGDRLDAGFETAFRRKIQTLCCKNK
jgi:hypothetical protein